MMETLNAITLSVEEGWKVEKVYTTDPNQQTAIRITVEGTTVTRTPAKWVQLAERETKRLERTAAQPESPSDAEKLPTGNSTYNDSQRHKELSEDLPESNTTADIKEQPGYEPMGKDEILFLAVVILFAVMFVVLPRLGVF